MTRRGHYIGRRNTVVFVCGLIRKSAAGKWYSNFQIVNLETIGSLQEWVNFDIKASAMCNTYCTKFPQVLGA